MKRKFTNQNIRRKILGKKGFEVIGDIPTWLITAVILLIFFIIFKFRSCSDAKDISWQTSMEVAEAKLNTDTLAFLRQTLSVGNEDVTMVDAIFSVYEIRNVCDVLSSDTCAQDAAASDPNMIPTCAMVKRGSCPNLVDTGYNGEIQFLGKKSDFKDVQAEYSVSYGARDNFYSKEKQFDERYGKCYALEIKKGDKTMMFGNQSKEIADKVRWHRSYVNTQGNQEQREEAQTDVALNTSLDLSTWNRATYIIPLPDATVMTFELNVAPVFFDDEYKDFCFETQ
ncbi:MAG: hypothetical protein Q8O89_06845 [Nanoarchaeota archaeon]|nr:hypothetical protein [Nanoarchaeota archaeon]